MIGVFRIHWTFVPWLWWGGSILVTVVWLRAEVLVWKISLRRVCAGVLDCETMLGVSSGSWWAVVLGLR